MAYLRSGQFEFGRKHPLQAWAEASPSGTLKLSLSIGDRTLSTSLEVLDAWAKFAVLLELRIMCTVSMLRHSYLC